MSKILIVDDSDALRMDLSETLELAGHEVIEGFDGADGLKKAIANPDLDLIITDLNMPEMDGISMSRRIRAQPSLAKKPIFMLTTESTMELKAIGKDAGVMLWIVKPFNGDKVLAAITKVLNMTNEV